MIQESELVRRDSIEQDPKYKKIIEQAHNEAKEIVEKECPNFGLGKCHLVWDEQKRILKDKYNIDWESPDELNPTWHFD